MTQGELFSASALTADPEVAELERMRRVLDDPGATAEELVALVARADRLIAAERRRKVEAMQALGARQALARYRRTWPLIDGASDAIGREASA